MEELRALQKLTRERDAAAQDLRDLSLSETLRSTARQVSRGHLPQRQRDAWPLQGGRGLLAPLQGVRHLRRGMRPALGAAPQLLAGTLGVGAHAQALLLTMPFIYLAILTACAPLAPTQAGPRVIRGEHSPYQPGSPRAMDHSGVSSSGFAKVGGHARWEAALQPLKLSYLVEHAKRQLVTEIGFVSARFDCWHGGCSQRRQRL